MGLDVQVRGLHARAEAPVRLLRAADALARPRAPEGRLQPAFGYVDKKPRDAAFREALDEELHRMTQFLAGR